MGHGRYSTTAYRNLRTAKAYGSKNRDQIFTAKKIDPGMDPKNVDKRESRDSEEHPESLAIMIGLDVTGSMGFVPEDMVKNSLPNLMDKILDAGINDPQILFSGIGDHVYDDAPLQVGQFESSAELLDRWLTKVYLEGRGGGNNCESYNLAFLWAARHTSIDCWERRRQKGFLFTIGDEPCATKIPNDVIKRLTTGASQADLTTEQILTEAQAFYHVYHLHVVHDARSKTEERKQGWTQLLGPNFVVLEDPEELTSTIATLIIDQLKADQSKSQTPPTEWML